MKKAVVPTTAARGAAVKSSRMTAVQSVYIGLMLCLRGHLRIAAPVLMAGLVALSCGVCQAGVVFDNCVTGADGSISCDTRPTGNTLMNDEAARYGLFDEASPGWAEYNPYQGYDQMLGGGSW